MARSCTPIRENAIYSEINYYCYVLTLYHGAHLRPIDPQGIQLEVAKLTGEVAESVADHVQDRELLELSHLFWQPHQLILSQRQDVEGLASPDLMGWGGEGRGGVGRGGEG